MVVGEQADILKTWQRLSWLPQYLVLHLEIVKFIFGEFFSIAFNQFLIVLIFDNPKNDPFFDILLKINKECKYRHPYLIGSARNFVDCRFICINCYEIIGSELLIFEISAYQYSSLVSLIEIIILIILSVKISSLHEVRGLFKDWLGKNEVKTAIRKIEIVCKSHVHMLVLEYEQILWIIRRQYIQVVVWTVIVTTHYISEGVTSTIIEYFLGHLSLIDRQYVHIVFLQKCNFEWLVCSNQCILRIHW
jgi:hypothetical protein